MENTIVGEVKDFTVSSHTYYEIPMLMFPIGPIKTTCQGLDDSKTFRTLLLLAGSLELQNCSVVRSPSTK